MRFFHLSDLHLGKSIYGVSLIDNKDQVVWVDRFIALCDEENPDAVVIAGDVYDRSSPSGDAVQLFAHLLTELEKRSIPVIAIAGNHDSAEKLSFCNELLAKQNVHISGMLEKELTCVTFPDPDGHGPVHFWMMPYLFASLVAQKLDDDSIRDYETAVAKLLAKQSMNKNERNVMIAHQNVTAFGKEIERGGSESMVGGVGQIDYSVFDDFDYVALGHIHSSYPVGREEVRYAGSPLCYHFNEIKQKAKGPILVEIGEKGQPIKIETQPIAPLHPMREFKGSWEEVRTMVENDKGTEEYIRVVLNDRRISGEISQYLRTLLEGRGSILMELHSDYHEFQSAQLQKESKDVREQPVEELFADYYKDRKVDADPSEGELDVLHEAAELMRKAMIAGFATPDQKSIDALYEFVMGQED